MESIVTPSTMLVVTSTYEHRTFKCIYCRVESICQGLLLPNFLRIMVMDMLDIGKSLMFIVKHQGIPDSHSTWKVRCVCKQKAVSLP
jgi:hypothetical protein